MVLLVFDFRVCSILCCCTLRSMFEVLISHEGIIMLDNLSVEKTLGDSGRVYTPQSQLLGKRVPL